MTGEDRGCISVIIPCAGWPATLPACLASVQEQEFNGKMEIIVVVNGPDRSVAPATWPGVTIIHERIRGPAAARNAGVKSANGDILAFIDSDCVAEPGWLSAGENAIRTLPAAAVIAGAITRSGAERNAVSLYDSVTFLRQEAYVKWSKAFVTANLFVSRSVFDEIGPFDMAFNDAAFEDWDWALRALRAKISVHYEPLAVIDHPCMTELRQLKAKSIRLSRGEITFRRKYRRRPARPGLMSVVWQHAAKGWRAGGRDWWRGLRLASIGAAAGFWRWQANGQLLSADAERRRRRTGS